MQEKDKATKKAAKPRLLFRAAAGIFAAGCLALAGCAGTSQTSGASGTAGSNSEYPAINMSAMDFGYSNRDKDASYDASSATKVSLAGSSASIDGAGASTSGADVVIAQAGTYLISGELENGQIAVETPDAEKVQIVLDGVRIHNESGPAIYVKQADKCFITLAPNSVNSLTDGASYSLQDGEDEPNATLFSKEDLTINGSGSLSVTASCRHAINSKDDLVITGGTFDITAAEDALRGKDCVKILDGSFSIASGEDAVKSSNDKEANRGYVCIDGGSFTIRAGDDAVHAETVLLVQGGNVDIQTCEEGYEAEQIYINDGYTRIVSNDDGLNASARGGSNANEPGAGKPGPNGQQGARPNTANSGAGNPCLLQINGGTTLVDARGDGVDSNGSIEITGGTLLVDGPSDSGNGFLDYDDSATISGGTVVMVGGAGMAECFSSASQAFVFTQASGNAGDTLSISDDSGTALVSFTPARGYQMVLASSPNMQVGSTYTLATGSLTVQATATTEAMPGGGTGGMQGPARPDGNQGLGNPGNPGGPGKQERKTF